MAEQIINIGTLANDGTGDTLREASRKSRDNDTELYSIKEDVINKKTDVETNKTSDSFYPSIKSIVDWVTNFFVKGSGTQNYLPKFGVGGKVVGNSQIFDDGTNVGIGKTLPAYKLDVNGIATATNFRTADQGDGNIAQFTKNTFLFYGSAPYIYGMDGLSFNYWNGSSITTALSWGGNGNVGIGLALSQSKLQVNGGVQMADDTAIASASKVGTQRYRVSGNNSYVDVCMQTGASTYAWVNTMTQSW